MKAILILTRFSSHRTENTWHNKVDSNHEDFIYDGDYFEYRLGGIKNKLLLVRDTSKKMNEILEKDWNEIEKFIAKIFEYSLGADFTKIKEIRKLVHKEGHNKQYTIFGYNIGGTGEARIIGEKLKKIFQEENNIDNIVERIFEIDVKKIHEEKEQEKNITLIKHRVAHLLLPLDIDLQGIKVVKSRNLNEARDYLIKIKEEKKGKTDTYEKKLSKMWWMIGKYSIQSSKLNKKSTENECEPLPLNENEKYDLLAGGKAVKDFIPENKTKEAKKTWIKLLRFSGLEPLKLTQPFGEINYISDSPILVFMCYLDLMVQQKNISKKSVNELLQKEEKLFKSFDSKLGISDFHTWFCELDKSLEKIRSIISN